ncbi:MAG: amidohydrolase/deacetylase family metallohydrolase [Bryobacteraceae bacterium]
MLAQGVPYDLILKGGHVIDPQNGVDAVLDVAITGTHIAAVSPNLPAASAKKVVEVSGLYVVPGLVDMHVHVFAGYSPGVVAEGMMSMMPDHVGFRAGVTTMVDAGSSGWKNFPTFKENIIDRSKTRVLAMLNIIGVGMVSQDAEQIPEDMDPARTAEMAQKNSDIVVGIKSAHWRAPNYLSIRKAIEAGKIARLPIMVDFFYLPERPYDKLILEELRPGDISTHPYRWPTPILDDEGNLLPCMMAARKRGVLFDLGHGGGNFYFRNAVPAVKQGFLPDTISSDLNLVAANGPMIDLPTVMSKFLAMGVPLKEVVRLTTSAPAAIIRHPALGQIPVGGEADVAVLRLENGRFGFADTAGERIEGTQRIACEMTIRAGQVVFDYNARSATPFHESQKAARALNRSNVR